MVSRSVMSIFWVRFSLPVEDGSVVVMTVATSVRISSKRAESEYIVSSIQKNVGVALTRTPIRSPISKRATSSVVPPLLITASWRAFRTPRPYL